MAFISSCCLDDVTDGGKSYICNTCGQQCDLIDEKELQAEAKGEHQMECERNDE